jgi:pimeloyl-ACP methyl ester carboxylesterase
LDESVNHIDELRGIGKLAIQATTAVTELVQEVQGAIGGPPMRLLSAPVYGGIRAITSLVGGTLDEALARLAPSLRDGSTTPERDAIVAALNGVLGDYLAETYNPLAIEMRLECPDGRPRTAKLAVFVHGSSMNRQAWQAARDLGYTPVHLDYNSGLHVSTNGRAFDAILESVVARWPVPVESIVIVAHSMGGLITRSACHYAAETRHRWRDKLRAIVFLGTPHHGAPLERAGNWLETLVGATRYSAPFARLGRIRSAGVTDLRFGNLIDEHWQGRDRFERGTDTRTPVPVPGDVACHAIAAGSDALVPVWSALGEHQDPALHMNFTPSNCLVVDGIGHLQLLRAPEVWDQIERWLIALEP